MSDYDYYDDDGETVIYYVPSIVAFVVLFASMIGLICYIKWKKKKGMNIQPVGQTGTNFNRRTQGHHGQFGVCHDGQPRYWQTGNRQSGNNLNGFVPSSGLGQSQTGLNQYNQYGPQLGGNFTYQPPPSSGY
ncbi:uncharacterized protein LOC133194696 [Saccostrea echinata]|uniref:uncharacterized protein LOC133194696 n=1 Tax=Saccostrea echinata TaxID=191078 RepID=UPI002A8043F5|nr:uncharacterized protein LOC133194696 [Saccostrea echinata]XP_061186586.1 uncharacterized protein LOC133194696 [Saccostrea echinata]